MRTGHVALLTTLVLASAGCSLFRGSPVPPPPPPPEAGPAELGGGDLDGLVERNEDGAVTGFEPLAEARAAVAEARADDAVEKYADEALARAETALEAAETEWRGIADAPDGHPEVLATVAHHSHQARRWAGIALAEAAREAGLAEIERVQLDLARIEAEDERWLGSELVPAMYGHIRFATGTARITGSGDVIARLVEFLQVHPRYALEVRGHTDDTPPSDGNLRRFLASHPEIADKTESRAERAAAYNRDLSLRRAEAVVEAVAEAGIDPARLEAKGFGSSQPVADNDTAAGRRANRRVEVLVVPGLDWAGR